MELLGEKIEDYVDELFSDLGLVDLPEEQKAQVFARVEERLHQVVMEKVKADLPTGQFEVLKKALEQQDYKVAAGILDLSPEKKTVLEKSVEHELNNLRGVIAKERRYAREESG